MSIKESFEDSKPFLLDAFIVRSGLSVPITKFFDTHLVVFVKSLAGFMSGQPTYSLRG
jgi:hypothetical protein